MICTFKNSIIPPKFFDLYNCCLTHSPCRLSYSNVGMQATTEQTNCYPATEVEEANNNRRTIQQNTKKHLGKEVHAVGKNKTMRVRIKYDLRVPVHTYDNTEAR